MAKFLASDHIIVICSDLKETEIIGFARFGIKDLYLYTKFGKVIEAKRSPCLLDFYVKESYQRRGLGKSMIDALLQVITFLMI